MTDAHALQQKLAAVAERMGPITGIIHGAGNLADKLIENKTEQDFELVYSAKIKGLENLLSCVPAQQLHYLVLFSSVAGFYGNAGQTDYAIANEILNKSAHLVKLHNPQCHVVAINWGPWDSGMVTPELKKAFAERNIDVIPLDVGAYLMVEELSNTNHSDSQVVIGSPIIAALRNISPELRTYRIRRKLTLQANPFLQDHVIGGNPVLPLTCAAAWMIESCEQFYPGYKVKSLENFKVLKGLVFDGNQPDTFFVDIKELSKTDTGELTFEVLIWSKNAPQDISLHYASEVKIKSRLHFKSQITLSQKPQDSSAYKALDLSSTTSISGQELYQSGTLFHGLCFQAVDRVLNISSHRLTLRCIAPVVSESQQGQFKVETFNPYITDSLCQSILIWAREFCQSGSLPSAIGKYEYFKAIEPGAVYYLSFELKFKKENEVIADVIAHDEAGKIYALFSDACVVLNKQLNSIFAKSATR